MRCPVIIYEQTMKYFEKHCILCRRAYYMYIYIYIYVIKYHIKLLYKKSKKILQKNKYKSSFVKYTVTNK